VYALSRPEFVLMNAEYSLCSGYFLEPIKSMCYKKWARPNDLSLSKREPTPTEMEHALLAIYSSWIKRIFSLFYSTSAS